MQKQTIILMHGALGSERQLEPLRKELSGRFDVLTFDFSGHGGKPVNQAYSMEQFSNDLLHLMEQHRIEKADLFGYSMGGYVALSFAAIYPEKVHHIVTLGTKFNWTPESAAEETRKLDPEKITEKVPAFASSLSEAHGEHWENVVRGTASMMKELGNGKALRQEDFSEIKANTLLLLAEQDSMVSLAETEMVQIALQNAELHIIPDAKHALESTDPKLLADIIEEFIVE